MVGVNESVNAGVKASVNATIYSVKDQDSASRRAERQLDRREPPRRKERVGALGRQIVKIEGKLAAAMARRVGQRLTEPTGEQREAM